MTAEPRTCRVCGESIEHLRSTARYCCAAHRFAAWLARQPPEVRESRLRQRRATHERVDSGRSTRKGRKGAERGTRLYLLPADLAELRTLTAAASARLTRKVADAFARIERP